MSSQHLEQAPRTDIIEQKLMDTRAGRRLLNLDVIDRDGIMRATPVYIRAVRKNRVMVYRIRSVGDYGVDMQFVDRFTRRVLHSWEYQQTQSSFWSNWTITLTTEAEWSKGSIA